MDTGSSEFERLVVSLAAELEPQSKLALANVLISEAAKETGCKRSELVDLLNDVHEEWIRKKKE